MMSSSRRPVRSASSATVGARCSSWLQLGPTGGERRLEFLRPPGHVYQPSGVAEIPLDLSENRRRRVGGKLQAAVGIEAINGLQQSDRADLHQVGHWLVATAEPAGEVLHERHVHLDELVSQHLALRTGFG